MSIPLIINQEQNAKLMLLTLIAQSSNHFEDSKHQLHIIYDEQEFVITKPQSEDSNILRGLMIAVIMQKSGFSNSFANMLMDLNLAQSNTK